MVPFQCHADNHHKVFIQMRHGTGYRRQVCNFDAGLLTMRDAAIHGTKNTATVPELIIQVLDGGQIEGTLSA